MTNQERIYSFNNKASYNLCNAIIVDHYSFVNKQTYYDVYHNDQLVLTTTSLFKACAKLLVCFGSEV